jgi:hypothetical protein
MRWECFTPQNRVRTLGLIGLFFLGACGSETTKTVTLRTGLEGAGEAVNIMKFWSPATFLSTPMCRQMDVRIFHGAPAGTPVMAPVETRSPDLTGASTLAQVVPGLRISTVKLNLPKHQPLRIAFLASITTGFAADQICPKLGPSGVSAEPAFSFRGMREITIDQQDVIDLRVWGLYYTGSTPSSAVCPGGDCPASHFVTVTPNYSSLVNYHLMIEFNPDLGFPARQILPNTGVFYIPRARSYRISKIATTGASAGIITPCTTPLTQQDINSASPSALTYTPAAVDTCNLGLPPAPLANFSNP